MSKILIIAEKPSVARDIGKVLKCSKKGDGYIFSDEYIISWAVGHLVSLNDPDDYNPDLKKWSFNNLPIIPEAIKLKPIKKTEPQLNILKKLMKDKEVTELICATDSGREGELIFRYIYEISKCKKPFKRLWISSMTDKAIKDGFKNLKDSSFYDNLYLSAKCRSEADWLVGINASRAYTLKYNNLLSIGRVQTPTLGVVVERQKEIDSFISIKYFEIITTFENYKSKWIDLKNNETKISDEKFAINVKNKIQNKLGTIINVNVEEKRQLPPLLYDLTELQRDCNKKYGFSAQKTLSLAQDLYEKRKLITYPRTDSRYLSDDMIPKIKTTLNKLKNIKDYSEYVNYILDLQTLPITKRIIDNSKITDHHAIIPADTNINLNNLSSDEFKVFNLIAKKFIAIFHTPYIYNVTKIITQSEMENFITKGNTVLDFGYRKIYIKDNEDVSEDNKNEDDEDILPNVKLNEQYKVTNIEILSKKTNPPKKYTEAMLLSAMENAGRFVENDEIKEHLKQSGIGTPATRASIIERLISVGYIIRNGKSLIATEKGMKLIEVVPSELKSPETTGKWEKGLTLISKGEMKSEKFMNSINRYVNFLVHDAKNSKTNIVFPQDKKNLKFTQSNSLGSCPLCKDGYILENSKGFFCSNWKSGCKYTTWKNSLQSQNYNLEINTSLMKNILSSSNKTLKNINLLNSKTQKNSVVNILLAPDNSGNLIIENLD